jgi:excisionase family DNA binding protein
MGENLAMTSQNKPKTYTPSEVAELLGLKPGTIYADLSRGRLRAYHYQRRRLITQDQLEDYKKVRQSTVVVDMTYACGPALKL